jgi:hypothetical protein
MIIDLIKCILIQFEFAAPIALVFTDLFRVSITKAVGWLILKPFKINTSLALGADPYRFSRPAVTGCNYPNSFHFVPPLDD